MFGPSIDPEGSGFSGSFESNPKGNSESSHGARNAEGIWRLPIYTLRWIPLPKVLPPSYRTSGVTLDPHKLAPKRIPNTDPHEGIWKTRVLAKIPDNWHALVLEGGRPSDFSNGKRKQPFA